MFSDYFLLWICRERIWMFQKETTEWSNLRLNVVKHFSFQVRVITGVMAFLGSVVRRVMAYCRPSLYRSAARCYSVQTEHTTEKSVPYSKTLKQEDGLSGPSKPLPRSADAVVIGGGSLGCQTLYHLCKMGMTNVVLLERDRLTAGTTWHTAGMCKAA